MKLFNLEAKSIYHASKWFDYRKQLEKRPDDMEINGALIYHCGCIARIEKRDANFCAAMLEKAYNETRHK